MKKIIKINQALVIFVGLSPDHHHVLCIEENGLPRLPMALLPEGMNPDSVAFDLKDTIIIDHRPFRPMETAYCKICLAHGKGIIGIHVHAEIIDNQCWMKCQRTGIWVPYRHLLSPEQPAATWEALLALEHKHRFEEWVLEIKRGHHLK